MSVNLVEALMVAKQAAVAAGAIIKAALDSRGVQGPEITVKSGVDLVTETDPKCEAVILDALRAKFPDHCFVGEESTFAEEGADQASKSAPRRPTWFVDPLDGTTNFVHAYPFVAVSIGLTIEGIPVLGVVYNPVMNEMYTAVKGQGAFLNGKPIHVSAASDVSHALVVNNIGASRDSAFISKQLWRQQALFESGLQALRASGSCAVNMAHVACGVLDACYEDGYGGPWDVCAGYVLVTEAGGKVTTPEGDPFVLQMGKGKILCGPGPLCTSITRILRTADAKAVCSPPASLVSASLRKMSPLSLAVGVGLGATIALLAKKFLSK